MSTVLTLALTISTFAVNAQPSKPERLLKLATIQIVNKEKQTVLGYVPQEVVVERKVEVTVEKNGKPVKETRIVKVVQTRSIPVIYSLKGVRYYDAAGNKLTSKEVEKRFKKGVTFVTSKDAAATAKRYVRVLKKDTIILVTPPK